VIVVHDAQSGCPIRNWVKDWKPGAGKKAGAGKQPNGHLYERLMGKVKPAIKGQKIETVTGLMNLLILPMWVGSGVFFSIDRFPTAVHRPLQLLPLTALIDALRAVALEGATLASQGHRLLVLAAWGTFSFFVGLRLFRWS